MGLRLVFLAALASSLAWGATADLSVANPTSNSAGTGGTCQWPKAACRVRS